MTAADRLYGITMQEKRIHAGICKSFRGPAGSIAGREVMADFFKRLVSGLSKTRDNIVSGMDSIFNGFSKIDDDFMKSWKKY